MNIRELAKTIGDISEITIGTPTKHRNRNHGETADWGEMYGTNWYTTDDIEGNAPGYLLTRTAATCVARHGRANSQVWFLSPEDLNRLVATEPRGLAGWWGHYEYTVVEDIAIVSTEHGGLVRAISQAMGSTAHPCNSNPAF